MFYIVFRRNSMKAFNAYQEICRLFAVNMCVLTIYKQDGGANTLSTEIICKLFLQTDNETLANSPPYKPTRSFSMQAIIELYLY